MSVDDYRGKTAMWYPPNNPHHVDGKEFFHNVTFEIHEVIDKIKISTMSLNSSKIVIPFTIAISPPLLG